MASSALIQGARDMGRAKIYNPYKFQAWIRSMFYGLDKLDDQMYNMKMARLSQLAKIQQDTAKRRDDVIKDQNTLMDTLHIATGEVREKTNLYNRPDLENQLMQSYDAYAYSVQTMGEDKTSRQYTDAIATQQQILTQLGEWKSLMDNFTTYNKGLHTALKEEGDISRASYYEQPLYWGLVNPNKHSIEFIQNEAGREDIQIIFENLTEAEKEFFPIIGKNANGDDVYGTTWSDFISSKKADYYLVNKGKGAQMQSTWDAMVQSIHEGESPMYRQASKEEGGLYYLVEKEVFSNKYAWDPTFRAPLTLKSGKQINKNVQTNLQSLAFDYDPDGVGGMTTFAGSTEALAIQDYYIKWFDSQDVEYQEKMMGLQEWGEEYPNWILDDNFAFGDVNLGFSDKDGVKQYEHAGRDVLSHAMNIYFGDATYDTLKDEAQDYINGQNNKIKADNLKARQAAERLEITKQNALKNTGIGDTSTADEKLKLQNENDIAMFGNIKDAFTLSKNSNEFLSNPQLRHDIFRNNLPGSIKYGRNMEPWQVLPRGGDHPDTEYTIWISTVENNKRASKAMAHFDVSKKDGMKTLLKYLFPHKNTIYPQEWLDFMDAQVPPRSSTVGTGG